LVPDGRGGDGEAWKEVGNASEFKFAGTVDAQAFSQRSGKFRGDWLTESKMLMSSISFVIAGVARLGLTMRTGSPSDLNGPQISSLKLCKRYGTAQQAGTVIHKQKTDAGIGFQENKKPAGSFSDPTEQVMSLVNAQHCTSRDTLANNGVTPTPRVVLNWKTGVEKWIRRCLSMRVEAKMGLLSGSSAAPHCTPSIYCQHATAKSADISLSSEQDPPPVIRL
jgi:hypothetical protein